MNSRSKKKDIFVSALITAVVFIETLAVLSVLGLAPRSLSFNPQEKTPTVKNTNQIIDSSNENYTRPDRISIPKVGIDSNIEKPNTADVSVLDNSLTKGAVHYPGSGSVEKGNMFLFGHSTNWQVVQNEAYRTFNGIEKLESGDEIYIEADGETYVYKVKSVVLVDEDDALVEFDNSSRTLTISTCNTFGEKQERWVVEADFERVST